MSNKYYSNGIVDWTKKELLDMDKKTIKIMPMNGCLHIRSNVVRSYLPRRKGGEA